MSRLPVAGKLVQHTSLGLLLTLAAGALPAQAGAVKDTLVKRTGERLRNVEILELSSDNVKYRRAGTESTLLATLVSHVEWSDPPEAYSLARGALNRGDTEAAANLFMEGANKATEGKRAALAAECQFLAGRVLALSMGQDTGRASAAKAALTAYLEAHAKGFNTPEARLLIARSQRVGGDNAGAEASLKALTDQAAQQGLGLIWDARAKLERAQLALAQNNPTAARSEFQGVRSAVDAAMSNATGSDAAELGNLRTLAVVSEGEAYFRDNKVAEAKKYFAQLATSSTDEALRAAALAGEAQAIVLQAVDKVDVKALREAQIKLAQATLGDTANSETTAKAMFFQAKILLALGPVAETDTFKRRARDYLESVARYYPSSTWAGEARAELQKK